MKSNLKKKKNRAAKRIQINTSKKTKCADAKLAAINILTMRLFFLCAAIKRFHD